MIRYVKSKIKEVFKGIKICPFCGKEISTRAVVCSWCGKSLMVDNHNDRDKKREN